MRAGLVRCLGAAAFLAALLVPASALGAGFGPHATVERGAATGKVRFVGTGPGQALPRPPGFSAADSPRDVGRGFLRAHAPAFGIGSADSLRLLRTHRQPRAATTVRYQQLIGGVPVLGGEFAVTLDDENRVISVGGEALPHGTVDTDPEVRGPAAARAALAAVAKHDSVPAAQLVAAPGTLQILDSRLIGGPGADSARLVWAVAVRSRTDPELRREVYLDADTGATVLTIDQTHEARNRSICDANNTAAGAPCTAPTLVEGGSTAGKHSDVVAAYDYSGATYDMFSSLFGRDSIDDAGMALRSTVRYCDAGAACPYDNAFWDGSQTYYGEGYAAADDVVAHELTHGVTEHTSNLVYFMESGSINESLSDVFGEAVDQLTPSADDDAGDKWKIGESVPGSGALRDMANPSAFGDPDRMGSDAYYTGNADGGGVHFNSGVNNKAAYLIADGGSFNGSTVTGLGLTKMLRVYYAAQTSLLTSGSDYADLGSYLVQACNNLVGTAGFVAADCTQVEAAVAATEMRTVDRGAPREAATCATGLEPRYALFDDMEASGSRWAKATNLGVNNWGFTDLYATSGDLALWGPNEATRGDYSAALVSPVTVPSNGFLRIRHYYGFEASTRTWDGGWVEYQVGIGPWTTLVPEGGYPGTIYGGGGADNPNPGHAAFVRSTRGYTSARFPLTALAGQPVRFRFRISSDSVGDADGWYIDDVAVYRCVDPTPPDTAISSGPSEGSTVSERSPQFTFSASDPGSSFECRVDSAGGFSGCSTPFVPGELSDGAHRVEVRARDGDENVDPTPAVRTFNVSGPAGGQDATLDPAAELPTLRALLVRARVNGGRRTATFRFRATGRVGAARFECRLDRRRWRACSSPRTYRRLKRGPHTFRLRARDSRNRASAVVKRRFRV